MDAQFLELKMLIAVQQKKVNMLTEGTPFAGVGKPDRSVLDNLAEEVKDVDFWDNYKKFSPILMCYASDNESKISYK